MDGPRSTPLPATRIGHADLPERIRQLSIEKWGEKRATVVVGRDPRLLDALDRVARFASADGPVLVTGETGTGKELFARALYLFSNRTRKPFLRINCAQYTGEQLIVSELFGHKRGSFTGAVTDHRGVFEEADGGSIFLDEVGELPLAAQAMLLRMLGEGEIVPVGGTHPRLVDVRVIAATSRDLREMAGAGRFRRDLYYRLRYLRIHVPPLRERGNDWELIARYYLDRLARRHGVPKALSADTVRQLRTHPWPGNVREVRSCVETGFHLSQGTVITPPDLAEALEAGAREEQLRRVPFSHAADHCARMAGGDDNFWDLIHRPFMDRDLNRAEVRAVIAEGLRLTGGSYKHLLEVFGIAEDDYLRFMDFLRHHRLKPERRGRGMPRESAAVVGAGTAGAVGARR